MFGLSVPACMEALAEVEYSGCEGGERDMRFWVLACASILAGCSSVQQGSVVSTPVAQQLTAGVGDTILRVEGRESMPNAFGNADVFGRTRPTGFTTIQYGGLQGGKVLLLRSGVVTQSEINTMSARAAPLVGATSVNATQPTIPIAVDWRANPRVPALGRIIVIEQADAVSLTYRIE